MKFNGLFKYIVYTSMFVSFPIYASEIEDLKKEIEELKSNVAKLHETKIVNNNTYKQKQENSSEIKLYGFIRADASIQDGGSSLMYNDINRIPLSNQDNDFDSINTTLNFSRLGMDIKTSLANNQNIKGKIELDFFGGSNRDQFRIRHAYLQYKNWTIGQTTSTFVAPEYMASSVDFVGYSGGAIHRTPLIAYSDKFKSNLLFQLSLEDPKYTSTTDPEVQFKIPVLATKIKYNPNDKISSSLRSFISQKKVLDEDLTSWGMGFGGEYQITPKLNLKGNYYHIKGDGRYVLWSNPSYIIDNKNIIVNEFDSINVGLSYKFSEKFSSTVGYGLMQYKNQDNESINFLNQNKKHSQSWINLFYRPQKPLLFGIEYVYGKRETYSKLTGEENRINFMASYSF
ncbi:DcaP family trimeric outer membrane transporter [Acinetobacter pittii]